MRALKNKRTDIGVHLRAVAILGAISLLGIANPSLAHAVPPPSTFTFAGGTVTQLNAVVNDATLSSYPDITVNVTGDVIADSPVQIIERPGKKSI